MIRTLATLLFLFSLSFNPIKGQPACEIIGKIPPSFKKEKLLEDFRIFETALREANPGLFEYMSPSAFDSLINHLNQKIKQGDGLMSEPNFYEELSHIVSSIREGHCNIYPSQDFIELLNRNHYFLPVSVKWINQAFTIDSLSGFHLRGSVIKKINNIPIHSILDRIYQTMTADGDVLSSKNRDLEGVYFSKKFSYLFQQQSYDLECHPYSDSTMIQHIRVRGISLPELEALEKTILFGKSIPPISTRFLDSSSLGVLRIDSFDGDDFNNAGINFMKKLKTFFKTVRSKNIQNIAIDLRNNTGGTEGFEDKLFSFFYKDQYIKYDEVLSKGADFSFFNYSDMNNKRAIKQFKRLIAHEFAVDPVSHVYHRKPSIVKVSKPQEPIFEGRVYIITSGTTYSGASEFCSLMRTYTHAVFVGEETGGAYQGNTSGYAIELTLPHSKIGLSIPLVQFKLHISPKYEAKRGICPDYVSPNFLSESNDKDIQLEFVLNLIPKDD